MAGHREHRKGPPGHKPGTPWDPEEWAAFKALADRDGGKTFLEGSSVEFIEWRVDGRLHREDGPAIVRIFGLETWFKNGKIHRLDGPAVIRPNGSVGWWKEGVFYTDGTFSEKIYE